MSEPKYPSLEEYYNDMARQAVEECNLCGECVRNCPIVPLTPIRDKAPEEIMEKGDRLLKIRGFLGGSLLQGFQLRQL